MATLVPTIPTGSSLRLLYQGEVGVTGPAQKVSFDLSGLPAACLEDPTFEDNFFVSLTPGNNISNVVNEVEFQDVDGKREMVFTMDTVDATDTLSILVWYIHSITR